MGEDRICATADCAVPYRGEAATCDYCGGETVTMHSARINGWVSVIVGIIFTAGMTVLAWLLTPLMFDPTGESFNGSRSMAYGILALLALIGMISALGIVVGIRRIRTGRVDMGVHQIMWRLATVLLGVALVVTLYDELM